MVVPMISPDVSGGNDAEGGANNGLVKVLNRGWEKLFATPGEGSWAVTLNEVCMYVYCKISETGRQAGVFVCLGLIAFYIRCRLPSYIEQNDPLPYKK